MVAFWFYWLFFSEWEHWAWDAPAAEAVKIIEQPFQDEALAPTPRRRGRGSSGREVLSHVVYVLGVIFMNEIVGLIICYFDC